jgi:hypothetical protein
MEARVIIIFAPPRAPLSGDGDGDGEGGERKGGLEMLGVGNSCIWDGDELNLIVSERSKPREGVPAVDSGMDGA